MHLYSIYIIYILYSLGIASANKNVLFIVSDDMRPELGTYYGPNFPSPVHPKMVTPHLDQLALNSLVLNRAYVQQAVCSPSRTSFLTGRRPDTTHVYDLVSYFRKVGGNFTTLPQYFKEHGYESVGMGKIFHPGKAASGHDDPISWSDPYYQAPNKAFWISKKRSWYAVPKNVRRDKPLPDDQITLHALKTLRRLAKNVKSHGKNFFLAVGFYKPHLPFVFPEEFLNFYPNETIHLPPNPYAPDKMPEVAWSTYSELRSYKDIAHLGLSGKINTTVPPEVVLQLRRAYYSSISYVDSLVGMILKELTDLELDNSTIISFVGDHGWHLGENGEWTKHTNFEQATHCPMIIRIPGVTDRGIKTDSLAEFVDLYPTIVEAAGLPQLPVCPLNSSKISRCREGVSLMPLTQNVSVKQFAISQYPRMGAMGYSIRTTRYRYTEWPHFEKAPVYKPDWNKLLGVELYDHGIDPQENRNVADEPYYSNIRAYLRRNLRESVGKPYNI